MKYVFNNNLDFETSPQKGCGSRVFNFLSKIHFLDLRKSDRKFEDWFNDITFEDFIQFLTRLNGILREVPIKKRTIDGKGVIIQSPGIGLEYLPPREVDKEILMREAFDALKSIKDNKFKGLLLYYVLQALHLYTDGNGRTGRLMYTLFSDEGREISEDKLSMLLDQDKVWKIGKGGTTFAEMIMKPEIANYFINRKVAQEILGDLFVRMYGGIEFRGNVLGGFLPKKTGNLSEEEKTLALQIFSERGDNNFPFRGITIAKILQETNRINGYKYKVERDVVNKKLFLPEDREKDFLGINGARFQNDLTNDLVRKLINTHAHVKRVYIRSIINIFKYPYLNQIELKDGTKIPIRELFIKQKNDNYS